MGGRKPRRRRGWGPSLASASGSEFQRAARATTVKQAPKPSVATASWRLADRCAMHPRLRRRPDLRGIAIPSQLIRLPLTASSRIGPSSRPYAIPPGVCRGGHLDDG